jgi:23S rRNA (guanine745-N1)-methyltransferase
MEGLTARDLMGIDNSKDAVRLAARRSPDMRFVVADVHDVIPLITAGAEVLLDIFAPRNPPEFARVLAPGGLLVIVIPAPGHLSKLGSSVPMLGMEKGKEERLLKDFGSSFRWMGTRPVEYNAAVSGEEAVDLVTMSPSYRHTEPQAIQSLLSIPEVDVDVRVRIAAFERTMSTDTVVIDPCD